MEQAEMVLHGRDAQAFGGQDVVGALDLRKVVVRHAYRFDLAAFRERNQQRRPSLHVHRVVYPVQVDHVGVQALFAAVDHLLHGVGRVGGDLRCELGRDEDAVARHVLDEAAQDALGGAFAVDGGGVPKVQTALQRLVENRLQVLLCQVVAKHLVAAGRSGSPRPCAKRDFRLCVAH